MKKRSNPVGPGQSTMIYDENIPQIPAEVKSHENDNLIFFHGTFEHLPAEEYKTAMSAICQYIGKGTIPAIAGLLKSVVLLAIDRIRQQAFSPRKRGGQIGNQNALKNECKTNANEKNESKTNSKRIKTNADEAELFQVPTILPQIPPAEIAMEIPQKTPQKAAQTQFAEKSTASLPESPPAQSSAQKTAEIPAPEFAKIDGGNLNLNSNLNFKNLNNINYLNLINCESENESERIKRIKANLKKFGFTFSDKVIGNIVANMPNIMWLTQGCDFPTYLAEHVLSVYKDKGKSTLELQKLFLSALNREKWETPWETYPNWLTKRMEKILVDQQAIIRTTPPQRHCPNCGKEAILEGMKCPKCLGFYGWDEKAQKHEFYRHFNFDNWSEEMLRRKKFNSQEETNGAKST